MAPVFAKELFENIESIPLRTRYWDEKGSTERIMKKLDSALKKLLN